MAGKKDLVIEQGKTFSLSLRYEAPPLIYRPIAGIAQSAPVRVHCPAHGIPEGWRCAVMSVKGMAEINAPNVPPRVGDYRRAHVVDADHIEFNDVNALGFRPYVSGGVLVFNTPVDLTGYTARLVMKDKLGGTVLRSLTTENGGITIVPATSTIRLNISATDTTSIAWTSGVYELELVSPGGVVISLLVGKVSVVKEIAT